MLTYFRQLLGVGKHLQVGQKLRKLKKRIFSFKGTKKRLSKKQNPFEIIKKSVDNMNSLPSTKYKQTPNKIEKNSLNSEAGKERFNFLRLQKIREEKPRQEKFNKKIYERKKLKLRSLLEVGEEVLVLTSQLKKKDSLGKFYKSSVDNKSYFHKSETFFITNRQKS